MVRKENNIKCILRLNFLYPPNIYIHIYVQLIDCHMLRKKNVNVTRVKLVRVCYCLVDHLTSNKYVRK